MLGYNYQDALTNLDNKTNKFVTPKSKTKSGLELKPVSNWKLWLEDCFFDGAKKPELFTNAPETHSTIYGPATGLEP